MPSPLALLFAASLAWAVSAAATTTAGPATPPGRLTVNFNPDWRFLRADAPGAAAPDFDDSAWAVISTPHTFNDTDTFDNWSPPGHRGEQEQWSGRTWYRKTFAAPAAWRDRRVFIEFEAVRQVAEVWLNGVRLGTAKSGFTPFGFDLTPHLRPGADNVLAVMADNRFQQDPPAQGAGPQAATTAATHPNLAQLSRELMAAIPATLDELAANQIPWNNPHWHPAHGGIYRNVRLIVTDPVHFTLPLYSFLQTEGPYVYAREVTADAATLGFEIPVENTRPAAVHATVRVEVSDAAGRSVLAFAQPVDIGASRTGTLRASAPLPHPRLWAPADPHLYRVALTLVVDGAVVDQTDVPLGLRQARWDARTGLWLNGAHLKLHGWGQKATNEWPGLGAAQPDWLQAHTLQLMRAAGGNFIRWGHVAGGPAQLAAADQLGLVTLQPGVDGEHDTVGGAWALRAATFRDVLIYYRNHPSILIWEGGNQKVSREHAAELRALMDRYDPHGGRAYAHRRADAITAAFMDVGIGTEGGREIARLPVVEGEYNREESPRRVWDDASPPNFGYPEAKGQTYQLTSEQFAVNQVRHYVGKLGAPHHAGGANWIFSDSTSGGRVATEVARASGEVDGVRLPKEAWFVTQVMVSDAPRAHLIGHWTYPEGTRKDVFVVANTGGEVELRLDGRPLGRARPEDGFLYRFPQVSYAPGTLSAVAYTPDGAVGATTTKHTVGPPVALRLTPLTGPDGWRADGADIALFDVEAVDAAGQRAPTVQTRVDFAVEGPAIWRGGYNSGRAGSINLAHLDLEAGINRVALRSTRTPGRVVLRATAPGLAAATAEIVARPFAGEPPAWPEFPLPAQALRPTAALAAPAPSSPAVAPTIPADRVGRYVTAFNYSGPQAAIVHVETDAANGRNAYCDADLPFRDLPPELLGADWTQTANRDARFHAVDLMEVAVAAGTEVIVAHDDRLPRPPWLLRDFQPTAVRLTLGGATLQLFRRAVPAAASLTLGPNSESPGDDAALMYLVFIRPARD